MERCSPRRGGDHPDEAEGINVEPRIETRSPVTFGTIAEARSDAISLASDDWRKTAEFGVRTIVCRQQEAALDTALPWLAAGAAVLQQAVCDGPIFIIGHEKTTIGIPTVKTRKRIASAPVQTVCR